MANQSTRAFDRTEIDACVVNAEVTNSRIRNSTFSKNWRRNFVQALSEGHRPLKTPVALDSILDDPFYSANFAKYQASEILFNVDPSGWSIDHCVLVPSDRKGDSEDGNVNVPLILIPAIPDKMPGVRSRASIAIGDLSLDRTGVRETFPAPYPNHGDWEQRLTLVRSFAELSLPVGFSTELRLANLSLFSSKKDIKLDLRTTDPPTFLLLDDLVHDPLDLPRPDAGDCQ